MTGSVWPFPIGELRVASPAQPALSEGKGPGAPLQVPVPLVMNRSGFLVTSVSGVPDLQPPRHDSYVVLNGFGYGCGGGRERGSLTPSSASP